MAIRYSTPAGRFLSAADIPGRPAIGVVPPPRAGEPAKQAMPGTVRITMAADIDPEAIRWLWPGYLARGKLHLLGGAPSAGKTTLAMALAATVSAGGRLPGGHATSAGRVLVWSGEDGLKDTLRPRLQAAGANLGKVGFIEGVDEQEGPRGFDPARDIPNLEKAVEGFGDVAMLVVDPIVSAVAGDGHKNGDVRRALQPLVDMLERRGIAGLGITHFSKGTAGRDPTERITGSLAFGALARVVLVAAKEEADGDGSDAPRDRRILTRAKSNIGPDGGGFVYSVEQVDLGNGIVTTRTIWGESLSGSARDILGTVEDTESREHGDAMSEAVGFLLDELSGGPIPVRELERSAADAGIAKATLRRAYTQAGVKKAKQGFGSTGVWIAQLSGGEPLRCSSNPNDAHSQSVSTLSEFEHLRPEGQEIEL